MELLKGGAGYKSLGTSAFALPCPSLFPSALMIEFAMA
jgi:hypothetical protein